MKTFLFTLHSICLYSPPSESLPLFITIFISTVHIKRNLDPNDLRKMPCQGKLIGNTQQQFEIISMRTYNSKKNVLFVTNIKKRRKKLLQKFFSRNRTKQSVQLSLQRGNINSRMEKEKKKHEKDLTNVNLNSP